ncbi:spore-associated protein [Actinomadura rubrisoli]|uniref:Spore-associated protein n=1 Tax=Actinomadura rubrisoli TaxID=2530368 RepID=A0A4R5CD94_9ACTN|nr:spore-associated protein [Actinomadura rubrisoli]TDD96826.1 spore-associated protein [Actinomadura rubrisoli]
MRKALSALAVVGTAAGALTFAAGPASADPGSSYCGSGYRTVDSHTLYGGSNSATIYLTYNSGNGYNCTVTVLNNPGYRYYLSTFVQTGSARDSDSGEFSRYAGPTYVYGRNQCVKWGGQLDVDPGTYWESPWHHC